MEGSADGRPVIRVEGLRKSFGHLEVLRGIDLEVHRGEVVVIFGRSGSGKSTLLRCINFLEEPTAGVVEVDGIRLEPGHRTSNKKELIRQVRIRTGMVFQQFNLFPHMTALENVIEGPVTVKGMRREDAIPMGMELLARVGLADKAHEYPIRLSGGQQQRVAIARALVSEPALLLADEPTGNLDSRTSHEIMGLLVELNRAGLTIVMVTHEPDIAAYARREVRFRDGRIVADERRGH